MSWWGGVGCPSRSIGDPQVPRETGGGAGETGGANAGEGGDAVKDTVVEGVEALRLVAGELRIGVYEEDVGAVHPHVFAAQILEGAQEQTGEGEEDQGKRNLGDDECPGQQAVGAPSGGGTGASAGVEDAGNIGPGAAQGGSDAEKNRSQEADAESEEQHTSIGGGGEGGMGGAAGDEVEEDAGSPEGDCEADRSAGECQEECLSEDLPHDAAAGGAEREAGAEFPFAGGCLGEEEIGEVGAGDEEHDPDHDHEHRQGRLVGLAEEGDARSAGQQGDEGAGDLLAPFGRELRAFTIREEALELGGGPGLSIGHGDALGTAAHNADPEEPVALEQRGAHHDLRLHGDGEPEIGRLLVERDSVECGRHDSDDLEGSAVDGDGSAEDAGVGGEVLLPVPVAEHGDGIGALNRCVAGRENAAEERLRAEHVEEAA